APKGDARFHRVVDRWRATACRRAAAQRSAEPTRHNCTGCSKGTWPPAAGVSVHHARSPARGKDPPVRSSLGFASIVETPPFAGRPCLRPSPITEERARQEINHGGLHAPREDKRCEPQTRKNLAGWQYCARSAMLGRTTACPERVGSHHAKALS